MDFCYLARRPSHTSKTLQEMDAALARFHEYRTIFEELDIRPNGFSLPRQHSLVHYVRSIKLFGSPNGLCSSITESKHITAVKRPWRRSSRRNPLLQIITTITRLQKLAAIRVKFNALKMLDGDIIDASVAAAEARAHAIALLHANGEDPDNHILDDEPVILHPDDELDEDGDDDEEDAAGVHGPRAESYVHLSRRPGECCMLVSLGIL